jgi:hypothetical protein
MSTQTAIFVGPAWLAEVLKDASIAIQVLELVTGSSAAGGTVASPPASTSVLSTIGNLVPKLPTDPITAGIDAGAAIAGDVSAVVNAENTPTMQMARLNVAIQKFIAKNTADVDQALRSGDATKVDEDLSP